MFDTGTSKKSNVRNMGSPVAGMKKRSLGRPCFFSAYVSAAPSKAQAAKASLDYRAALRYLALQRDSL